MVAANERAVTRSRKESGVDECAEHCVARGWVEAPEPLRLLTSQPQTWHFEILASNTSNNVLDSPCFSHQSPVVWFPVTP
jgi:hypothetical protein